MCSLKKRSTSVGEFHHFGLPLLVGMSRKSMVGQLLNVGPSERLNGAKILAVTHNVFFP
jgi:dihydropteroate synthase